MTSPLKPHIATITSLQHLTPKIPTERPYSWSWLENKSFQYMAPISKENHHWSSHLATKLMTQLYNFECSLWVTYGQAQAPILCLLHLHSHTHSMSWSEDTTCPLLYHGLTTVLWPQATYEALSSLAGDAVATYSWLSTALRRIRRNDVCEIMQK